jgi:hypothetical protein
MYMFIKRKANYQNIFAKKREKELIFLQMSISQLF